MRQYLKPFWVCVWALIFLSPALLVWAYLQSCPSNLSDLPVGSFASALFDFNIRLHSYQSDTSDPKTVIVGPSYAAGLKQQKGTHNLGLYASFPSEYDAIAKAYIIPNDTVICIASMRDLCYQKYPPRKSVHNVVARSNLIGLTAIKYRLRRNAPISRQTPIRQLPLSKNALREKHLNQLRNIENPFVPPAYINLARTHGVTVFLLFPTITSDPVINKLSAAFRNNMLASELTVIDLSGLFIESDFFDLTHLNEVGVSKFWSFMDTNIDHPNVSES